MVYNVFTRVIDALFLPLFCHLNKGVRDLIGGYNYMFYNKV